MPKLSWFVGRVFQLFPKMAEIFFFFWGGGGWEGMHAIFSGAALGGYEQDSALLLLIDFPAAR